MNVETFMIALSVILSALTLSAALIGLIYAYRSDSRKSGTEITGTFSWVSSFDTEDVYIGTVTLQNMKDRAVIIYSIYLEIGHGHFLEIEDCVDDPLVLEPFGVCHKSYGPVDFYASNLNRVRLNNVLEDRKTRRRIILSTSSGRYTVDENIRQWTPIAVGFRNQFTGWFRAYRSTYEGKIYGSRIRFRVRLTTTGGKERTVAIHSSADRYNVFADFKLTAEALKSKESLEEFLWERAVSGELPCSDLEVVDWESHRNAFRKELRPQVFDVEAQTWFTYYVLGWLWTRWKDFKWRRSRRRGQAKKASSPLQGPRAPATHGR